MSVNRKRTVPQHMSLRDCIELVDPLIDQGDPYSRQETIKETKRLRGILKKASDASKTRAKLGVKLRDNIEEVNKQSNSKKGDQSENNVPNIETFTSPGKILGAADELLYDNKFVNNNISDDISQEDKERFRKYRHQQLQQESTANQVRILNSVGVDPSITNPIDRAGLRRDEIVSDRFNKPRVSVLTIDSSFRDHIRYPNANHFKMDLRRQYRNVKSVRIISSEFPNTDQLIKSMPEDQRNNRLYWVNDEDADEDYDCLVYDSKSSAGNYTATELETELGLNIGTVNRFSNNIPHEVLVSIDTESDIVKFQSIQSVTLSIDPITVSYTHLTLPTTPYV